MKQDLAEALPKIKAFKKYYGYVWQPFKSYLLFTVEYAEEVSGTVKYHHRSQMTIDTSEKNDKLEEAKGLMTEEDWEQVKEPRNEWFAAIHCTPITAEESLRRILKHSN
jgi:hypothetical protein